VADAHSSEQRGGSQSGRRLARRLTVFRRRGCSGDEPADLRDGYDTPERWRLHLAWPWTVVVERLMWARGVVVT
jgi:hypothetical protein